MPTGRSNQLTKQRGEYLVAAELTRRGLLVATFSGNVPDFDLVAVRPDGSTALVQVKASASTSWQLKMDDFVEVEDNEANQRQILHGLRPLQNSMIVWVMLQLRPEGAPRYWVLRLGEVQQIVYDSYEAMLAKVRGHRPRQWRSHHTAIWPSQLEGHEDRWELVVGPQIPSD